MTNFLLRALTSDNTFHTFTLQDIPVLYDSSHIILSQIPFSPILSLSPILRGDPETSLFEGDIILYNNKRYLVCYERGFYAISSEYQTIYLYQLKEYTLLGNYLTTEFPMQFQTRNRQVFKSHHKCFDIRDIIGSWNGYIILISDKTPFKPDECFQEVCMYHKRKRLFLNDIVESKPVELIGGRICIRKHKGIFDLSTRKYLGDYPQ